LGDENKDFRSWVGDPLGRIGEPAVPALIQALGDENKYVRSSAAYALERIGEPAKDAVPALIQALGDENLEVRSSVIVLPKVKTNFGAE